MNVCALRQAGLVREGWAVLSDTDFTPGESVGYNAHHGGVCCVGQTHGRSGHNARDPPATTPVSLLRP